MSPNTIQPAPGEPALPQHSTPLTDHTATQCISGDGCGVEVGTSAGRILVRATAGAIPATINPKHKYIDTVLAPDAAIKMGLNLLWLGLRYDDTGDKGSADRIRAQILLLLNGAIL